MLFSLPHFVRGKMSTNLGAIQSVHRLPNTIIRAIYAQFQNHGIFIRLGLCEQRETQMIKVGIGGWTYEPRRGTFFP